MFKKIRPPRNSRFLNIEFDPKMEICTYDEPHFLCLSMQHFCLAPEQGVQIEQNGRHSIIRGNFGECENQKSTNKKIW